MGQSNNFDGPILIDELDTTTMLNSLGFGRAAYSVDRGADTATGPSFGPLSVDPSAGAGVPANLGSLAMRYSVGNVQLWQKTTAPDTGWTLIGGGSSSSATQYVFVWSEGNPAPHDNVYASWATLYAAAIAVDGEVLVDVDDLSVNPPVFSAGTFDLTKFKFTSSNAVVEVAVVGVPAAVVWSSPFKASEFIAWNFTNTVEGSVYTAGAGALAIIYLNGSSMTATTATPFLATGGGSIVFSLFNSAFTGGKNTVPIAGTRLTSELHIICEGVSRIVEGSIAFLDAPAIANVIEVADNTSTESGANNCAEPAGPGTGDFGVRNIRRTLLVRDANQGSLNQVAGDEVVRVDCTAGNQVFTLLAATDTRVADGQCITVKKNDATANTLTINGGGTNIDGAATLVLTAAWQVATIMSDGALWSVVSN